MLALIYFFVVFRLVRVLIEVLEVLIARQFGDPWRLNALLLHDIPVNALEPGLLLDVLSAAAQAAQALREILLQQTGDQRAASHRDIGREFVIANRYALVNVVRVRIVERRVPVNLSQYAFILTLTASHKAVFRGPTSRLLGCDPDP